MRVSLLLAGVLLATPAAAVDIRHQPLSCVRPGAHTLVSASADRVEDVATAELQFRRGTKGRWYAVPMFLEGEAWSARLPQPKPRLKDFQYRVVMTSTNLEPRALEPIVVRVHPSCPTPAETALPSPIVVRVPRGASEVPPGFEQTGLVAAADQAAGGELDVKTAAWAKIAAGAAVVAGGAAIAISSAAGASAPTLPPGFGIVDNPGFAYSHTVPPTGAAVSLRGGTLSVFVNMLREPNAPLDLAWRFDLAVAPSTPTCVIMEGVFNDARSPLGLVLTAPLRNTGACGDRFDVTVGRLIIAVHGTPYQGTGSPLYDTVVPVSYRFEP